ncbi:hypothetical protein M758_2G197200 [Ceratodon purpureus]|nr:hypothetical protein M758_2G197200 [Ceratodon purpureus]
MTLLNQTMQFLVQNFEATMAKRMHPMVYLPPQTQNNNVLPNSSRLMMPTFQPLNHHRPTHSFFIKTVLPSIPPTHLTTHLLNDQRKKPNHTNSKLHFKSTHECDFQHPIAYALK